MCNTSLSTKKKQHKTFPVSDPADDKLWLSQTVKYFIFILLFIWTDIKITISIPGLFNKTNLNDYYYLPQTFAILSSFANIGRGADALHWVYMNSHCQSLPL